MIGGGGGGTGTLRMDDPGVNGMLSIGDWISVASAVSSPCNEDNESVFISTISKDLEMN